MATAVLHAARRHRTGWSPLQLPGLTFWLDSHLLVGLNDGDAVTSFTDQSGNGNHATGSGGTRPLYKTGIINSLPALLFSSVSSQRLTLPNCLTGTGGTGFFVAQQINDPPSAANSGGPVFGGSGGTGGGFGSVNQGCHEPFTDGVIYETYGSTTRQTVGNPTPSLTSPHIYSVVSATNDWRCYLNGTSLFSTATNTVGWQTNPTIGTSQVTFCYDGYIAVVLQYAAALSNTDRRRIEAYLGTTWNITVA